MKSAAQVLEGLRAPAPTDDEIDRALGLGEHAPVLDAEQTASRDKLIADFTAPNDEQVAEMIATSRREFGLSHGPKLDPIRARLASWSNTSGDNVRRVGPVLYSWDANPRVQQNGSALGRVYAQERGELPRDVGGFKIDRDGNVINFPAAARADFPGVADSKEAV